MSYSILIVDDSRTVRRMIERTIALAGIAVSRVDHAANGREALERLESLSFDLVLTDLNMPEMDGMELVQTMAERGWMSRLPVVVVSTEGSDDRIQELRRFGIRGFLRKPVTPEGIKTIVAGVLGG